MLVSANAPNSNLSIDIKPNNWNMDLYPTLEFAYKIPINVPVGLFFLTEDGWICLGGTASHSHGSYPSNDVHILIDDDQWHMIRMEHINQNIREVYPSANIIAEFEFYTFGNAQTDHKFWFDKFEIHGTGTGSYDQPPSAPKALFIISDSP
jgi:hypothetical protein